MSFISYFPLHRSCLSLDFPSCIIIMAHTILFTNAAVFPTLQITGKDCSLLVVASTHYSIWSLSGKSDNSSVCEEFIVRAGLPGQAHTLPGHYNSVWSMHYKTVQRLALVIHQEFDQGEGGSVSATSRLITWYYRKCHPCCPKMEILTRLARSYYCHSGCDVFGVCFTRCCMILRTALGMWSSTHRVWYWHSRS